MKAETAEKILKKVKQDYVKIGEDFSKTRKYPWKEFENFKKYIKRGDQIADIGCGNGRLQNELGEEISYTGIDNNEKLLAEARKNHPKENFIKGDLLDIPLDDESCDITFCIAALHHIPSEEKRKMAVKELKRITKKDGIVIIMVWNLWQKKYLKQIIKAVWSSYIKKEYDWNDLFIPWKNDCERYYHAFTKQELKKLLQKELKIEKLYLAENNYCAICKNE